MASNWEPHSINRPRTLSHGSYSRLKLFFSIWYFVTPFLTSCRILLLTKVLPVRRQRASLSIRSCSCPSCIRLLHRRNLCQKAPLHSLLIVLPHPFTLTKGTIVHSFWSILPVNLYIGLAKPKGTTVPSLVYLASSIYIGKGHHYPFTLVHLALSLYIDRSHHYPISIRSFPSCLMPLHRLRAPLSICSGPSWLKPLH